MVWTLHDCWPYTGHCAFYDYNNCGQWRDGCKDCKEYRNTYPYALFKNNTANNYKRKKAAFTGVANLTIVTPSRWLADEVKQSFLKDYPVQVIPNGVDQTIFRPTENDLRKKLGLEHSFVILGVANVWERRKGLSYFCGLAKKLPEDCKIILIGLNEKQIRELPEEIIGITRTENAEELAGYYSMADVFVNATLEDNFPTTNLEALSCGTPVITFETGGSPESLDKTCGRVVRKGDAEALLQAILAEREHPMRKEDCLTRAAQYEKNDRFMEYAALYHRLWGQGE